MSRLDDDLYVDGTLRMKTLVPSALCISDSHVAAGAAIDPTKVTHQRKVTWGQSGTAAAVTIPLFLASGAGTIKSIKAGSIVACTGNATITIDVKKNGTTILSATIVLDVGNTARVAEAGVLSVTSIASGDLIEAVVTVNAGTGALGSGLFVTLAVNETAEP